LAVQFISIKEAGFNRKATRGKSRVVAFCIQTGYFNPGRAGNSRTEW
jgi:hypothetical protein